MKKLILITVTVVLVAVFASACAKQNAAPAEGTTQETTQVAKEETETQAPAQDQAQETVPEETTQEIKSVFEIKNVKDYEEFGKNEAWFLENYGEPDEYEDDSETIIMTYYSKDADYILSEEWETDEDGNDVGDDAITVCYEIDGKRGDEIIARIVNHEFEPETEPVTEEVIIPNPNGPQ